MGLLDNALAALSGPQGPEGGRFGYYPDPPAAAPSAAGSGTLNPLPRVAPVTAQRATDTTKLVADCGAPRAGVAWLIRRLSVQGPAGTRAMVYAGDYTSPASWVNGTNSGDLDETECQSPIPVYPGQHLYLVWTLKAGGTFAAGTTATVRVEYDEVAA